MRKFLFVALRYPLSGKSVLPPLRLGVINEEVYRSTFSVPAAQGANIIHLASILQIWRESGFTGSLCRYVNVQ